MSVIDKEMAVNGSLLSLVQASSTGGFLQTVSFVALLKKREARVGANTALAPDEKKAGGGDIK